MICPMSSLKFVGTISLGLLTGVSFSLPTLLLPSLPTLPTASVANSTLSQIQTRATHSLLTLASISSLSLLTAYTMASPRNKHPYLLWTALMGFLGGQGVEFWYNGLSRFPSIGGRKGGLGLQKGGETERGDRDSDSGFVEVDDGQSPSGSGRGMEVNGEKVEQEMARERKVQLVRTLISGLGFAMGVVGIWGDGA